MLSSVRNFILLFIDLTSSIEMEKFLSISLSDVKFLTKFEIEYDLSFLSFLLFEYLLLSNNKYKLFTYSYLEKKSVLSLFVVDIVLKDIE